MGPGQGAGHPKRGDMERGQGHPHERGHREGTRRGAPGHSHERGQRGVPGHPHKRGHRERPGWGAGPGMADAVVRHVSLAGGQAPSRCRMTHGVNGTTTEQTGLLRPKTQTPEDQSH